MNRSKKLRAIAALGTLSGAVWAGTFATFTDDATAEATFTAGELDLLIEGEVDDTDYAFSTLSVANLKPGDVHYGGLQISNVGSLPFDYALATSTADGTPAGLGAALRLEIATVAGATCDSTTYAAGTVVRTSTALAGAAIADGVLSLPAATTGDDTDIAHLCFRVTFPDSGTPGAENALQGASTVATFTFTATQP